MGYLPFLSFPHRAMEFQEAADRDRGAKREERKDLASETSFR